MKWWTRRKVKRFPLQARIIATVIAAAITFSSGYTHKLEAESQRLQKQEQKIELKIKKITPTLKAMPLIKKAGVQASIQALQKEKEEIEDKVQRNLQEEKEISLLNKLLDTLEESLVLSEENLDKISPKIAELQRKWGKYKEWMENQNYPELRNLKSSFEAEARADISDVQNTFFSALNPIDNFLYHHQQELEALVQNLRTVSDPELEPFLSRVENSVQEARQLKEDIREANYTETADFVGITAVKLEDFFKENEL